jgi:hypothetical protein
MAAGLRRSNFWSSCFNRQLVITLTSPLPCARRRAGGTDYRAGRARQRGFLRSLQRGKQLLLRAQLSFILVLSSVKLTTTFHHAEEPEDQHQGRTLNHGMNTVLLWRTLLAIRMIFLFAPQPFYTTARLCLYSLTATRWCMPPTKRTAAFIFS